MVDLPPDTITNILSRLPLESLAQCRGVCKTCQTLIHDPLFVDIRNTTTDPMDTDLVTFRHRRTCCHPHHQLHYGEYNQLTSNWIIVGSCNGLICLTRYNESRTTLFTTVNDDYRYTHIIRVYNPFTEEYANLPEVITDVSSMANGFSYNIDVSSMANGFSYNTRTKEYTVVLIYKDQWRRGGLGLGLAAGHVKFYTLGSGKWRRNNEEITLPEDFSLRKDKCAGVFVNGALHWINHNWKIVCFDLETERFKTFPAPPPLDEISELHKGRMMGKPPFRIVAQGGCLCTTLRDEDNDEYFCILAMNKEEEGCWTKIFSNLTPDPECFRWPIFDFGDVSYLAPWENNIVLFWRWDTIEMFQYDFKSGRTISVESFHQELHHFEDIEIIPCVKSFISLKALGEENAGIPSCAGILLGENSSSSSSRSRPLNQKIRKTCCGCN